MQLHVKVASNSLVLFNKIDLILPIQSVLEVIFSKLEYIFLSQLLLLYCIKLGSFLCLLPLLGVMLLIREYVGVFLILGGKLALHMDRASSLA